MNLTAPIAVSESSQVAEARRAATVLAQRLGFSDARAGEVALIATELATNLVKHATGGEFLLRPVDAGDGGPARGLEMLALDRGPGLQDPQLSSRDGFSTTGTLGHGLGAIRRQAHVFDLFTGPAGTAMLAQVWPVDPPPARQQLRIEVGAVNASKQGEMVCGDSWSWRLREGRLAISVADGLGHGIQAQEASAAAMRVFSKGHEDSPQHLVEAMHAALRSTRGAAVAVLAADLERGTIRYAGLGNIAGVAVNADGTRQSMVSHNGTAGHSAARVQEFHYPLRQDGLLVMHSDGLGTHWNLSTYAGLRTRHASLIAGVLYRDFSRRRDDVTVVVARQRQ